MARGSCGILDGDAVASGRRGAARAAPKGSRNNGYRRGDSLKVQAGSHRIAARYALHQTARPGCQRLGLVNEKVMALHKQPPCGCLVANVPIVSLTARDEINDLGYRKIIRFDDFGGGSQRMLLRNSFSRRAAERNFTLPASNASGS